MSRTRQEAARWAARRFDDPNPASADFDAWKAADPANAAAFDDVWRVNADPALAEAMTLSVQRGAVRPRRGVLIGAVASGLASCALALVAIWPQLQLTTVAPLALETAPGQHRTAALADGTTVTLDGATRLEVKLGQFRREVRLVRGEAYFDVAHDESRPFTVKAPEGSARVLGTAFDLEREQGRLELSVHRGRVRLAPSGLIHRTAVLTIGQQAFAKEGRLSRVHAFDPNAEDWRAGWLETDGVTLASLVERLNRASTTPIVIADPDLGRQRVAGRFRLDEPEVLVRNLALMHGFQVRREQGGLTLTR